MEILVVAQSALEYGAVAAKGGSGSAGGKGILEVARYRLESYIGEGNAPSFLAALLVLVVLVIVFRRKWAAR